jgi:hypothetical protein
VSNPATTTAATTVKVLVVEPLHEVDGTVLKPGFVYEFAPETAAPLIASGAAKKQEI